MPTKEDLQYYQAMPLDLKITFTMQRIREWVREFGSNGVYVSFSGGKDSTVLADLYAQFCKEWGCEMWLVFVNTGLEYPEIQKFVKWYAEYLRDKYGIVVHLEILRPKMRFDEVIRKYGYPIISKEVSESLMYAQRSKNGDTSHYVTNRVLKLKGELKDRDGRKSLYNQEKWYPLINVDFAISNKCCAVMKKSPAKTYSRMTGKKPITAQMASESRLRTQQWLINGCNGFDMKDPISNPMSFWTEQDVLHYIRDNDIPIAEVYGNIEYADSPEQLRFEELGVDGCGTDRLCTTGCDRTGCIFCGFGAHLEKGENRFEKLKCTHPRQYQYCIGGGEYVDGVWQPNKQGLGMGHVFDELNKIYGDGFIRY